MLPGGLSRFLCLYAPLKGSHNRIALTSSTHDELDGWRMLLDSLASRPMHIHEIIPDFPTWTGAHDASGRGMGGIYAGPDGVPYLWRHPWTTTKAACLIYSSNPTGDLSINDFELAGNVAQLWLALPKMAPLSAILNGSDNSTSIWWIRKGSTNTSTPAECFLRLRSWLLRSTTLPPQQHFSLKKRKTSPMPAHVVGTCLTHKFAPFSTVLCHRPHLGQCST
jgi:hypothetical protein